MADQVAASHDGDAAGFSSATSSLVPGDREEFNLHIYASDMLLVVQSNSDQAAARVLHLKNVREATLAEAQTAVNSFFDQFEPLDNGRPSTVFQMFDQVHEDSKDHIERALGCVEDVQSELTEIEYNDVLYPKRPASTTDGNFNPIAEVMAACDEFLKQVRSIQAKSTGSTKDTGSKRYARVVTKGGDSNHGRLGTYVRQESVKRDLGCRWDEQSYPGHVSNEYQVRYHVRLAQDEGWVLEYKDYGISLASENEN
ncbi:unnamed protein product [Clonostachys rhizophaga]|uniref:Uncharacterized protein n=1 Tax=Clonostachys rhizophaga TaxID=160324 RepID=A0A9N9VKB0_9HYPO|nr:unnamed protein product [Clonostachys rhizophaga]